MGGEAPSCNGILGPVNVWIVFTQAALKQGVCQVHSSASISIKMILEASEAQVKKEKKKKADTELKNLHICPTQQRRPWV